MLLPISTDAPLYHYPISTILLIVANFVCFVVAGADNDAWVLHYGTLNPLEWLTSIFAHNGIGHLVGNMFFLWAFGLIVEGKLGWTRFLMVYLAIGVGQSGLEQMLMLGKSESAGLQEYFGVDTREELEQLIREDDPDMDPEEVRELAAGFAEALKGSSCGASAAIFGLLAICLVWAPRNEFNVLMFVGFRVFNFDVTIMYYSLFYFAWEAFIFTITGFSVGSAFLHLMGAAVGFGVGVLFLKKDWVDCENWDLFRVLSGNYGRFANADTTVGSHANPKLMFGKDDVSVKDDIPIESKSAKKNRRLKVVTDLIDAGDFMTASEEMYNLQMVDDQSRLDEARLKKLSLGLMKANMLDDAAVFLEEYVERFSDNAAWARVRHSQILLAHMKRPAAALEGLRKVRLSQLTPELQKIKKKIGATSKKQIQAGVKDADPEW